MAISNKKTNFWLIMMYFGGILNLVGISKKDIDEVFINEGIDAVNKKFVVDGIMLVANRYYGTRLWALRDFSVCEYPGDYYGSMYQLNYDILKPNVEGWLEKDGDSCLYSEDCMIDFEVKLVEGDAAAC